MDDTTRGCAFVGPSRNARGHRAMARAAQQGVVRIEGTPDNCTDQNPSRRIRSGPDRVTLDRQPGGWSVDATQVAVPAELVSHLDTALRLMNVSEPAREIPASELTPGSFAEFGLDPPANVALLEARDGVAATVNFGTLNPAGTSNYVRLGGAPTVFLMPRHVGVEWRVVFDMARRLRGQAEFCRQPRRKPLASGFHGAGVGHRDRLCRKTHSL